MAVQLLNPLPRTLHHYVGQILAASDPGTWMELHHPGIEAASGSPLPRRVQDHVRALGGANADEPLFVAWPAFGHLEPLLLRRRRAATVIAVHDPRPLRRQAGHGRGAVRLGVAASRKRGVTILAHSVSARLVLQQAGYADVVQVPLPMSHPSPSSAGQPVGGKQVVRILGQNKQARDVTLLEKLGWAIKALGAETEIVGSGWPTVDGWSVRDEFVDEVEFSRLLSESAAVLIPYARFFQSDVAVRAAEAGRPVIGPAVGFLTELFGAGHPGLVAREAEVDAWLECVSDALRDATPFLDSATIAADRACTAWSELVTRLAHGCAPR